MKLFAAFFFVSFVFLTSCSSQDANLQEEVASSVDSLGENQITPPSPTQTSFPTDTPFPQTETPKPSSPTPIPTDTPSPTPTLTSSPTVTPSATPTATPTETPSPTLTPSPVPIPTSTPRPEVPAFPLTEVAPFSEDAFQYQVGRLRDTMIDLDIIFQRIMGGGTGDCTFFGSLYINWTQHMPVFEDVPEKYDDLYLEYRSIVYQAGTLTQEIGTVCANGGGTVSEETDRAIVNFIQWAKPRTEAMVTEIAQLR